MPLEKGSSDEAVGRNIKREQSVGKPRKQAIAIALKTAGRSNQEARRTMEAEACRKTMESVGGLPKIE